MKNLNKLLGILLITTSVAIGVAQKHDIVPEQLQTVYLHKAIAIDEVDDFLAFNETLTSETSFKDILKSTKDDRILYLNTQDMAFLINERDYVKTLRKSVNRSKTYDDFKNIFANEIPQLLHLIEKESSLQLLYKNTRDNTFNGRLDNLPSVL